MRHLQGTNYEFGGKLGILPSAPTFIKIIKKRGEKADAGSLESPRVAPVSIRSKLDRAIKLSSECDFPSEGASQVIELATEIIDHPNTTGPERAEALLLRGEMNAYSEGVVEARADLERLTADEQEDPRIRAKARMLIGYSYSVTADPTSDPEKAIGILGACLHDNDLTADDQFDAGFHYQHIPYTCCTDLKKRSRFVLQ